MAWKPENLNALPSEDEIERAMVAIDHIKAELEAAKESAEMDLGRLARDLEELQVWIAPVRRIPFEILSEIILMTAKIVWWSPAIIARVCRWWRDVALATPCAWSLINLKNQPPAAFASMFFERSGEFLLHLAIPASLTEYEAVVRRSKARIQCLAVTESSRDLLREQYHNLTRLSILYPRIPIPLEYLVTSAFPNLKYLDAGFLLSANVDPIRPVHGRPAPIEHLVVATDGSSAWITAIRTFYPTLNSLQIAVSDHRPLFRYPSLELPKVTHLAFTTSIGRRPPWHFEAKTPSLTTYRTIEGDGTYSVAVNVAAVTRLQTWEPIPLLRYDRLRQLRVYGYKGDPQPMNSFIDQLSFNHGICIDLEYIITDSWDVLDIEGLTRKLIERNEYTGVNMKIMPASDSDGSWPGDSPAFVRFSFASLRYRLMNSFSVVPTCPAMYKAVEDPSEVKILWQFPEVQMRKLVSITLDDEALWDK